MKSKRILVLSTNELNTMHINNTIHTQKMHQNQSLQNLCVAVFGSRLNINLKHLLSLFQRSNFIQYFLRPSLTGLSLSYSSCHPLSLSLRLQHLPQHPLLVQCLPKSVLQRVHLPRPNFQLRRPLTTPIFLKLISSITHESEFFSSPFLSLPFPSYYFCSCSCSHHVLPSSLLRSTTAAAAEHIVATTFVVGIVLLVIETVTDPPELL